ncbi:transposon Ty3-I Gag-Pol polyprotein [Trichonephila clavipes]|nr:transposon Ty3-I Gag-Pol polyprotein [Trichonephila clavipes]
MVYNNNYYNPPNISPLAPKSGMLKYCHKRISSERPNGYSTALSCRRLGFVPFNLTYLFVKLNYDSRYVNLPLVVILELSNRTESISVIDYDKIADAQVDNEEFNKLRLKPSLNFKQYPLDSGKLIWCDISTANIRPFIPQPLRMHMFQKFRSLAHPGVKSTVKQIASRFIRLNTRKDVNQCIQRVSKEQN